MTDKPKKPTEADKPRLVRGRKKHVGIAPGDAPTLDVFHDEVLPEFEASQVDWLKTARAEARIIFSQKGEVTIDDVRDVCPPPANCDPRVMGAVFKLKGEWICTHYVKSARRACHHRPIGVFVLC